MTTICLFGTTRLEDGPRVLAPDLGGNRPRQVLELLALSHGRVVTTDRLADALWDGRPPTSYVATLQSHVCLLRRHLAAAGVTRDAIRTVTHGYLLTDAVEVDLTRLRSSLHAVLASADPARLAGLSAALPPEEDVLLSSSPYDSWATEARDVLDVELGKGLRSTAERCLTRGDHGQAVVYLTRAARIEPHSEVTQQLLMRALADGGSPVDAMISFAHFRSRLREDLGIDPSPSTVQLHLDVLRSLGTGPVGLAHQERGLLLQLLRQLPAPTPVQARDDIRTAAAHAGVDSSERVDGVLAS